MVAITVVGASGLIGTKVVEDLRARGHRVVAASRSLGVDTVTGEGLEEALSSASVVVDVTNPGGAASGDALAFFETSTRNLLATGRRFGVRHHVVLSVVGTDTLAAAADPATTGPGYFHAKRAQEDLVKSSGMPYTIVRATQFYEFVRAIVDGATEGGTVRVPPIWFQPLAADDVAREVADAALGQPANGTIEIAGPERLPLEEVVARSLAASDDARRVVTDPAAGYFGVPVERDTLVPQGDARLGIVTLHEWLGRSR